MFACDGSVSGATHTMAVQIIDDAGLEADYGPWRRRWAWVALTILSFNPLAWIINAIYLRKRWAE